MQDGTHPDVTVESHDMQDDTQMSQLNHMTCRMVHTQMSQLNHMTCRMVEEKLNHMTCRMNSPVFQGWTMPIASNTRCTPERCNPRCPIEKQTTTAAKALLDEELSLRTQSIKRSSTPNEPALPQQSMNRNQKINGTSAEIGTTDKELRQRE
ncbi:unnamed protein product [Mytilus coruscus]|uniref:Uncharacterized protein n=1 Tax=Mytilus coruscus TaxID=42192 RepID=A0A6J8CLX0_MYTCO|nr:unnamed protein product [Mytilus coruscus]